MDADGAADEQHVRRTAKSCGSDAPTLASSWRKYFRWRRWQTSPVTGKSTKETVKTIARGMPGCSGVTVVTMLVCFFNFACEAAGASRARHSLRPLMFQMRKSTCKTRAPAARSRSCVCWAGAVSVGQLTRESAVVMAGRGDEALLRADVPAIHVFLAVTKPGRGSPGQAL